jgi:hypothetical protein
MSGVDRVICDGGVLDAACVTAVSRYFWQIEGSYALMIFISGMTPKICMVRFRL